LSARRKEVTSITSLTSSQFTVEFIKVSNIYFKICGRSGQCRDIQNMHETQVSIASCLHIPAALPMSQSLKVNHHDTSMTNMTLC
jgi:hypothetical protein